MSVKQLTPEQQQAYANLNIPLANRTLLCLDGWWHACILTLQLLKKIEEIAGIPCYQIFDMVSGTSTGAIIAGLMMAGKKASENRRPLCSVCNQSIY